MEKLKKEIISKKLSLVSGERFDNILYLMDEVKKNDIEGDFLEAGVWKGGMSIFMAKYINKFLPNKKLWMCDSFQGCQGPDEGIYEFEEEIHEKGRFFIPFEEVEKNLKEYEVLNDKIKFCTGWFRDTLLDNDQIEKLSLLRVDCDSYSAIREVLDGLYKKVSIGGFVIIDDYCLITGKAALTDFVKENKLNITFMSPVTNKPLVEIDEKYPPCGMWWRKEC